MSREAPGPAGGAPLAAAPDRILAGRHCGAGRRTAKHSELKGL